MCGLYLLSNRRMDPRQSKHTGVHTGVNISTDTWRLLVSSHCDHGDGLTEASTNINSVKVEKSWYDCTNTAYQILPQDIELLCIDLSAIALRAQTITWFCCQAARWMLRPSLPVASCGPGSGPINPLGLLSAFVSGLERLSGGYKQRSEADHSEVSEALHSLTSHKSQLTNFGFNVGQQPSQTRSVRQFIHMDAQCPETHIARKLIRGSRVWGGGWKILFFQVSITLNVNSWRACLASRWEAPRQSKQDGEDSLLWRQ